MSEKKDIGLDELKSLVAELKNIGADWQQEIYIKRKNFEKIREAISSLYGGGAFVFSREVDDSLPKTCLDGFIIIWKIID